MCFFGWMCNPLMIFAQVRSVGVRSLLLTGALLLFSRSSAIAQTNAAVLLSLRNADSIIPLAGAKVSVQGPSFAATFTTGNNGHASFGTVPTGTYTIDISGNGFSRTVFSNVALKQEGRQAIALLLKGRDAPEYWNEFFPTYEDCRRANPEWRCNETIALGGVQYYRSTLENKAPTSLVGVLAKDTRVIGTIEGVRETNGSYSLEGWACAKNSLISIDVSVYAGGPAPGGNLVLSEVANNLSEAAIASACNTNTVSHRFSINLDRFISNFAGQAIYVHGISPNNQADSLLTNSGQIFFPGTRTSARSVRFASSSSLGDFDGDGMSDYADFLKSSGDFWIHRNYGTRFRKLRIAAQSTANWIGIYEAEALIQGTNVARGKAVKRLSASSPQYEYAPSNLTDGNNSTLAYPGSTAFEYEIDLGNEYDLDTVRLNFGYFGIHPTYTYITSWQVDGITSRGEKLRLADGGNPGKEVEVRQVGATFSPTGTNWGWGKASVGDRWRVLVGDFTGDGKADFADYEETSGLFWIHENLGNGNFNTNTWSWSQALASPDVEVLVGEFNGDQYADILERNVVTGELRVRLNPRKGGAVPFEYSKMGGGFKTQVGPNWRILVGDFNGDGLSDIADVETVDNRSTFWMHLNNGAPDFDFSPMDYGFFIGTQFPQFKTIVGDFTGDRRADIAELLLSTGEFWVHENRGDGEFGGYGFDWGYAITFRNKAGWLLLGE